MTEYDETNPPPLTDDDAPVEARNEPRPEPKEQAEQPKKKFTIVGSEHPPDSGWRGELRTNGKDKIYPEIDNIALVLANAPEWRGSVAYDKFACRLTMRKSTPIREIADKKGAAWTDADDVEALIWLQTSHEYSFSGTITEAKVRAAIKAIAARQAFHSLQDHLNTLPEWDGIERVNHWLSDFFLTKNDTYTQTVGRCWLISAMARAYRPGCKCDYSLVFEGKQGGGKSEAMALLAYDRDWFTDDIGIVGTKDAAERIAGRWIVEISELTSVKKSDVDTVKSYLTRREDKFRPAWGHHSVVFPRQCVFGGTVNPDGSGYLKDLTGDRRFWPIACAVSEDDPVNNELLLAARDQLWAEAKHAFVAGEKWYLDAEVAKLANGQQRDRRQVDTRDDRLEAWLEGDGNTPGHVGPHRLHYILEDCFGLKPDMYSRHEQHIARLLTARGYGKRKIQDKWFWDKSFVE